MVKDEGVRQDAIAHNRTHLSRGYPKGVLRVTSTNFLPSNLWAMGVQLAALNWQTFGEICRFFTSVFT
jgi:phosphatidylinositol phospholipase C delta